MYYLNIFLNLSTKKNCREQKLSIKFVDIKIVDTFDLKFWTQARDQGKLFPKNTNFLKPKYLDIHFQLKKMP